MGRFAADDSGDLAAVSGEDFDTLAEHYLSPPAADGDELDEAVEGDVLDHEADFVHVAGDEDAGAFIAQGADDGAAAICGEGSDFPEFI